MSNDVEKIIELHEKAKKADEYKLQLEQIEKISVEQQNNIAHYISNMYRNDDKMAEIMLKENTNFKAFRSINNIIKI